jgi:ABC-type glutathione transport system ATPase component
MQTSLVPAQRCATDALLAVEGLVVAFPSPRGEVRAVDGIDFTLGEGEVLGLVGRSGAGKSVTGAALAGLVPPPGRVLAGSVRVAGERIDMRDAQRIARLRGTTVSSIFQDPLGALDPLQRICTQLVETLRHVRGLRGDAARALALELLRSAGLPDPATQMARFPHQLSGGLRQRASIALSMAPAPRVLVADEPTTALDVRTQARILSLLRRLADEQGLAVLLVSHDIGAVASIADRIAVLDEGRIVEAGATAEVLRQPRHACTRTLVASIPPLRARDDGRSPREPACASPPLVRVRALRKRFGGAGLLGGWATRRHPFVQAIDGIDFDIHPGECLALVGESGSGKTTVGRLVAGLDRPDSGSIEFGPRGGSDRLAPQMVFQDPYASLNPRWPVGRTIGEPLLLRGLARDGATVEARVAELLRQVGLAPADAHRYPHQFSGGQRQRISIARALAAEPVLLVCDEPTSSLDVSVQAQVLALLDRLRRERGLAMLYISHDLAVVSQLSDRVAVMREGRIVEIGETASVFARPRHPYTAELLAAVPDPVGPKPTA